MQDTFVWDVKRDCLLSQNSLRCRRHLTPVSNVCEVAPIFLISAGAPNRLNELPEVRFEFSFKLIGKGFFNRPIMARTQILVQRLGPEQGFRRKCNSVCGAG